MQSGYPWNQSARGEWRGGCTYSRNKFTLRLSYTVPCMIIISPFFHYFFHFQRRPSSNIRFNTPRSFSGDSASRWQGVSQTQLVTRVVADSRRVCQRMMRRDFNYHAGQHSTSSRSPHRAVVFTNISTLYCMIQYSNLYDEKNSSLNSW